MGAVFKAWGSLLWAGGGRRHPPGDGIKSCGMSLGFIWSWRERRQYHGPMGSVAGNSCGCVALLLC